MCPGPEIIDQMATVVVAWESRRLLWEGHGAIICYVSMRGQDSYDRLGVMGA
jgi:hypothetical protein